MDPDILQRWKVHQAQIKTTIPAGVFPNPSNIRCLSLGIASIRNNTGPLNPSKLQSSRDGNNQPPQLWVGTIPETRTPNPKNSEPESEKSKPKKPNHYFE